MKLPPHMRKVEIIDRVIHTVSCEGEGIKGNPSREVHWYWTIDGELLAKNDLWEEENKEK